MSNLEELKKDMRKKMSILEKLKQDMDQKRKTADAADAAYEDAYAAYEDAAYVAAKKKYEAALEQASATSSERVSISREDAKDAEVLFRASAVMAANYDNMATSTDFERSADRIKTALEAANE